MNPHNSAFFSRQPTPESTDHPLSIHGRFGRLSWLAWGCLLHIIVFCASVGLSLASGIFSLSASVFSADWLHSISSLSGLGMLLIVLFYLYGTIVIHARRLHDLNKSGWWMLLFAIPVLNILVWLYLLLASGRSHNNRFGLPRPTPFLEKLLGWMIILMTALSLFAGGTLFSYMLGAGDLEIPVEITEKTTEFF